MKPLFVGSRLKIKRANHHIENLASAIQDFVAGDFYRLYAETNPEGKRVVTFESTPLPEPLPLMLGDAIHNLRSALDLMAFELVTFGGGTPSKTLYFPVSETREKLVASLQGEIKIAGQPICDLILDTVKSYKGGNDPLWSLHQLDIMDKHRLIIPTAGAVRLAGLYFHDDNRNQWRNITFTIGAGERFLPFAINGDLRVTNHGQAAVAVFFPPGSVFEGESLFPTLPQLSLLVEGIIDAFEKAYLAGK